MGSRKVKKPTLLEVAKRSGVSQATVSRVLNGNSAVDDRTRRRVESAVRELKYSKRRPPRDGRTVELTTVGLIVPDLSNPFFPTLIKGIENVSKMYDVGLVLCDSENSVDLETRLLQTLLGRRIDGLLFVPVSDRNPYVTELIDRSFPMVFVDRQFNDPRINSLTAANEHGAYQAIQYLVSLGHRKILYIGGQPDLTTERDRLLGYRQALEESGIAFSGERVIRGNYAWADAKTATAGAIAKGVEFTAIFSANDVMAFGAIQALEGKGIRVPEDVSVLGFDDIPFSGLLNLTTVSQHPYDMGMGAMTMLIHLLQNRLEPPNSRTIMPSLIIRKSCQRVQ